MKIPKKAKTLQKEYGLRKKLAVYLSLVSASKDFREYENRKSFLKSVCSSPDEYDKAHKCLVERMGI